MGYDVNYSKNIEMQLNLDNLLSKCSESLDIIETVLARISGTGSLQCKAKTALSAYINDVILGVMIPVTKTAISYLSTEVSCYVFEMYGYDNDEHAIIQEDFLNALNEKLNSLGTDALDILGNCRTVAGDVSDILSLDLKSTDDMSDAYAGLSEMVLKTRDDIGGYLESFRTRAGDLYNIMSAFYTTVSTYSMGSVDMTTYAGEYHNNTSLEDLQPKVIEYVKNIGYTQQELDDVATLKNDVITAYIREKESEQKLYRIGFLVVGAVSLICPFAMGFTIPATIASLSISSIAIVYNADQVYQGVQLMDAAETRDTDAEIDTLVHFDNEYMQQAYEVVGEIATSYTCSLVMASITPGAGNGNVTFKSVMTDVGDDYIGGLISDGIEQVTGQSNILIDQMTGLLVGHVHGKLHGDLTPGHVSSQVVDIDTPNGSRVVANAVDDVNVKQMVPDVEVSGVDLQNGKVDVKPEIETSYGKLSGKIGDFTNLEGSTVDEILDRIPDEAVLRELYPVQGGATEGFEFKWVQDGQTYRVRVHNEDPSAPVGSNAYNGWVVRVQRGRRYYDPTINDFREAKYFNLNGPDFDEVIVNDTHIPIVDPYQN